MKLLRPAGAMAAVKKRAIGQGMTLALR